MISEKKRRPTAAAARLSFEQPPRQTTFANAKCNPLLVHSRFFFFVLEQRAVSSSSF
jgi:hypothetical protein